MRKILIVGASASGLLLAHALLRNNYEVTMITSQSSPEIRTGGLPLGNFTLSHAHRYEQSLRLDLWQGQTPHIQGVELYLTPPEGDTATIISQFGTPGVSVDRRIQMADWLEYFEDLGGKVVIHGVTVTDLDYFATMFDLVVVAVGGGGELGQLFDREEHIAHAQERTVAQSLLDGVDPSQHARLGGDVASVGSARDIRAILAPVLTREGPGHILQLVSAAGSPMDRWPDRPGPEEQLSWSKQILARFFPALHERVHQAELLAGRSSSLSRISPHARQAVARLPSGGHVLGLGDMVVTTDPIAAQGSNLSAHGAQHYHNRILAHGSARFDAEWMQHTFDTFWAGNPAQDGPHAGMGQAASGLSEMLDTLWEPHAPAHVGEVFSAATAHQQVADRVVAGLEDPRAYAEWLLDPATARSYLSTFSAP